MAEPSPHAPRPVRPADAGDLTEVIRLRQAMFGEMASAGVAARPASVQDTSWHEAARAVLTEHLSAGTSAAFVIEAEHGGTLIACAVAGLDRRLPGPGFPTGLSGGMSSVYVEPAHRGRGLARAVAGAALDWLTAHGAEVVDIHATPAATPLYRSLGFAEPGSLSLRRLTDST